MGTVASEAQEGNNMCKKYRLQVKRPHEKHFTEWCSTDDYKTIKRNIKTIEGYGYIWKLTKEESENEKQ